MVSVGYELGSRVFSSLRVWSAIAVLTFALCEGAGFGAFSYRCLWYDPFSSAGPQCTLTAQPVVPPGVSWATFAWNAATLWFGGLLDGGFAFGVLIAVAVLAVASRMSSAAATRAFSFVPILAACAVVCLLGYTYEVHATIAEGLPQIR